MRDKVQRQFVQKEKGKQGEREEERRSDKKRERVQIKTEREIKYTLNIRVYRLKKEIKE